MRVRIGLNVERRDECERKERKSLCKVSQVCKNFGGNFSWSLMCKPHMLVNGSTEIEEICAMTDSKGELKKT